MSSLEAHRSPQHHHGYSGRSCAQQRARCSLRNDIHGRLTSKRKRAATSQGAIARALRLASESVERAHQNGARTLRSASANVEKAYQNGARMLRNASTNVEKSRPSGARKLLAGPRAIARWSFREMENLINLRAGFPVRFSDRKIGRRAELRKVHCQ